MTFKGIIFLSMPCRGVCYMKSFTPNLTWIYILKFMIKKVRLLAFLSELPSFVSSMITLKIAMELDNNVDTDTVPTISNIPKTKYPVQCILYF